ncbi:MAG: tetratricopeptide repeat protein [Kiritimatiellia bacterium]
MHHRGIVTAAAGLLAAVLCALPAYARAPAQLLQGMSLLEAGLNRWDQSGLEQALEHFDRTVQKNPMQYEAWYMKGLAEFHLMLLHESLGIATNRELTAKLRDAAEHSMDRVLSLKKDFGEACALKAVLLGMAIAEHPLTAVWRGPRLQKLQKKAFALDPENPRIWYLMGMSRHFAPRPFGSEEKAKEYLLHSAELFEHDQPGRRTFNYPAWGHAHCLMFLGEICREQGNKKEAARYYRKALAVNPHLDGVRKLLKEMKK